MSELRNGVPEGWIVLTASTAEEAKRLLRQALAAEAHEETPPSRREYVAKSERLTG